MSAKLAMRVFESALPSRLKPTAAVFALFAADDGSSAFPSLSRVAWSVGVSVRQVRTHVSELCATGVLVATTPRTGGARRTTRYRLLESALPDRGAWDPSKGGSGLPGSGDENPEADFRVQQEKAEVGFRAEPEKVSPSEDKTRKPTSGYPGSQLPGTPEASFRRSVSDQSISTRTAAAPRCTDLDRQPNGDNYRVILKVAHEVLEQHPYSPDSFGDFVDAVKWKCAELKIIYGAGRHPDVDHNVTHRACASALVGRLAQRCADAGLEHAPGRRRARRAS